MYFALATAHTSLMVRVLPDATETLLLNVTTSLSDWAAVTNCLVIAFIICVNGCYLTM